MDSNQIEIKGARVNNLKNIDVNIPRNTLTVITGLSGSGNLRSLSILFMQKVNDAMLKVSRLMLASFSDE